MKNKSKVKVTQEMLDDFALQAEAKDREERYIKSRWPEISASKALIVNTGKDVIVLSAIGMAIWQEIHVKKVASYAIGYGDNESLSKVAMAIGLDNCPPGIWVWEGSYPYREDGDDSPSIPAGNFKEPIPQDWWNIISSLTYFLSRQWGQT
jgi:hypothetical protein